MKITRGMILQSGLLLGFLAASLAIEVIPAHADIVSSAKFQERDGEALYKAVCQGCHMSDGNGASGAGAYPALSKNVKLQAVSYPIYVILNGQKGMPALGAYFDDEQIANVVNYVRTHFGNAYDDVAAVDQVKSMRASAIPR